jgi:cyclic pyranopterin phosphate synthase
MLTFEEILRLVRLLTETGIRRVKVTGGEPLIRRGLSDLIRRIKALPGVEQVTLTTNGTLLAPRLSEFADAGIDGINISLDTLNRKTYRWLTGFDGLQTVLGGIASASAILPVKLNVVPIRGVNEDELCDLAAMAKREVAAVRFIELMPVGCAKRFPHIDTQEVKNMLEARFGALPVCADMRGNGPAEYVRPSGFRGGIGFVHAMSQTFCGDCNRVRLTADGRFMPCLGQPVYADVKQLLRGGGTDDALLGLIGRTILAKPLRHGFRKETDASERDMNAIGG